MSLFLALIIILLVWFFIIAPFIRLMRISSQWQNTFKRAQQEQQQYRHRQQRQHRRSEQSSKRKIDPNVGEYVEFTETIEDKTETDANDSARTAHTVEPQVTDVTWEDLPGK